MFCQKCGKPEQLPNNFCRQCGEFIPDLTKNNTLAFGGNTPNEKLLSTYYLSLTGFLSSLVVLLGLIWGGLNNPRIVFVTAVILGINIFLFAGILFISIKMKKRLNGEQEQEDTNLINEISSQNLLGETGFENYVPASVTEKTTKNLEKIKSS